MQVFSVSETDNQVLCRTPYCRAEIRPIAEGDRLGGVAEPRAEVVLCVIEGGLDVSTPAGHLDQMTGVQIPAGQVWSAMASAGGAKVLRIDSPHPGFDTSKRLMPALTHIHQFAVADGQKLVYTDYVRGGVLNFAPEYAAEKHFHQDADEIFWFFSGTCQVTGPEGQVGVDAGNIVYTPAGEWHIIENIGREPLLMFVTVTPNIVPSHTFFHVDGTPYARSMEPLTHP